MKILSLFYILLFVNDSLQLGNNDFDMDYINYLVENFSMNKSNRFLHLKDTDQEVQTRSLKENVPKMKNFQKEFFHMIRDTVFQAIKSFIQATDPDNDESQENKFQFPKVDKDLGEFLSKNFEYFQGDELKEDQYQKFENYSNKIGDLDESQDQFFRFSMDFEGQQKEIMQIHFIPLEVKQRLKKKKDGSGEKKERQSKEMTVNFKNDVGEAKIKVPIVLGKDRRILDFIKLNVQDFLGKSLQIIHNADLLDIMLNNILSENFGSAQQELTAIQNEDQIQMNEGVDLDKIINASGHHDIKFDLHHKVYKLDIGLDYAKQMINEHFKIQTDEIVSREFLYFLLVPNSQDLENIDVIIHLKDNKITYAFLSNFFTHFNYLDISTYTFVGFNFDLICKQISQDLRKNILLLYKDPQKFFEGQNTTSEQFVQQLDTNLKTNFDEILGLVFVDQERDSTLEFEGADQIDHDLCMKLHLPKNAAYEQSPHFWKCYPKDSQFIVQIYQVSFLQQLQQRLVLLYENEQFDGFYLKQKINPFIQLDKEKGFERTNWQREIVPKHDKPAQKHTEFTKHIIQISYLVGSTDQTINEGSIKFEHIITKDVRRRLRLLL